MGNPPDYKSKRRCDLAAEGQRGDNQSTNDHANKAPYHRANRSTLLTHSTSQSHIATPQPQAYSSDDKHDADARAHDLGGERCAPHLKANRQPDNNRRFSSIQLSEYRDDRDSSIIHFGVTGTHEGKTLIPKSSVHRNALDDLAHPYVEDQDFYMLEVNLDGDQIDHLLQCSEIYDAGGECTILCKRPQIACLPNL